MPHAEIHRVIEASLWWTPKLFLQPYTHSPYVCSYEGVNSVLQSSGPMSKFGVISGTRSSHWDGLPSSLPTILGSSPLDSSALLPPLRTQQHDFE